MRPSLLPGLIAAARRNLDRGAASVRLFEVGRRYLADARASDARRCCSPASGTARGWQTRQGASVRRLRRQGRSARVARRRRRAGRQSAGLPGRRADLASGPFGDAAAWGPRRSSPHSASFIPACRRALTRRPARWRPKSTSTRSRRRAASGHARTAYTPPALQPVTRDFAFIVPAEVAGRHSAPRDPRRRQGGDHAARLFDRFEAPDGLSPGGRSDAPAGREELHRRADRRDLEADRRCGGEARRAASELDSSALIAAWTRASISSALEGRRDCLADLEGDSAAAVDKAAPPQAPLSSATGTTGRAERSIERREARLQRRRLANANPRAFGIDDDRPPGRDRLLARFNRSRSAFAPADRSTGMTP